MTQYLRPKERVTDERIKAYLRRFGPAGLTTAQIASGLGVSHGSLPHRLHACDGVLFEKVNSRLMVWRLVK